MKQLEVLILQQSYLLSCPEGQEERLLDAVQRVDSAMVRIRDAGKVRARERIAVLAALNLAFEVADREANEVAAAELAAAQQDELQALAEARAAEPQSPFTSDEQERLQALMERLDHALGDDGRLL